MARAQIALYFPSYVWPDTQRTDPLGKIRACIERAEHYGFDIWVIDHLLVAPGLYGATWLDPFAILNYAAALTRRVHLGTGILVAPVRQPAIVAKEIGSLQVLCEGRFKLGVGPGWDAKEFEAVGHHGVAVMEQLPADLVLALEVSVDGAFRDSARLGNVASRRFGETLLHEQAKGLIEDRLAGIGAAGHGFKRPVRESRAVETSAAFRDAMGVSRIRADEKYRTATFGEARNRR